MLHASSAIRSMNPVTNLCNVKHIGKRCHLIGQNTDLIYLNLLATGWTVRGSNPGGGEIFLTCPGRPWGPPSLLYNGYRVFPGGKERPGRNADTLPLLVPWSRKSRAIPLLPLWAVRPVQRLSACSRVNFTLSSVSKSVVLQSLICVDDCSSH